MTGGGPIDEPSIHVHYGMTGSFPLRMAELFFGRETVTIAEYSRIMPLFGILTRQHERDADAMLRIAVRSGVEGVCEWADEVYQFEYAAVGRIDLHDGGMLGRPKIAVETTGTTYAYRVHGRFDTERVFEQLRCLGIDNQTELRSHHGIGYDPMESLRRFIAQ